MLQSLFQLSTQFNTPAVDIYRRFVAVGTGSIVSRAAINTRTVDIQHQFSLDLLIGCAVLRATSHSANSADEP